MPNSIVEFAEEWDKDLQAIIDETFFRLLESTDNLTRWMPLVPYEDVDLAWAKITDSQMPIAHIVAEDAELPSVNPGGTLTTLEQSTIKLGAAFYYTDKDFRLMHKLRQALTNRSFGDPQQYIDRFFGVQQMLSGAIANAHTKFTTQVLMTGQCIYQDPKTKAWIRVSYPSATGDTSRFPAALAGANTWDNITSANGIRDLTDLAQAFYDVNGFYPSGWLMDTRSFEALIAQESTKRAVLEIRNQRQTTDSVVSFMEITPQELGAVVSRRMRRVTNAGIEFVINDAQHVIEQPDGSKQSAPYVLSGRIAALVPNAVERALVGTPESDFRPQIVTETEELRMIPKRTTTGAIAGGIPLVTDGRLLAGQQVMAAA